MNAVQTRASRSQTPVRPLIQSAPLLFALAGIATGAAFEAAIALRWISMGTVPGADPAGRFLVLRVAVLAAMLGVVVLPFNLSGGGVFADRLTALLALLAASLLVARFFSFDAYYLSTLRRMSDGGILPGGLVATAVVLAIVASAVSLRLRRTGRFLTAVTLLLCSGLALSAGAGH